MLLNYFIVLIFIVLFVKNLRKGVILLAITSTITNFMKSPFADGVGSLYVVLSLVALLFWMIKFRVARLLRNPLTWCVVLPLLSYIVTMYATKFQSKLLLRPIINYMMPVMLYYSLKSVKELKYYMKVVKVFVGCVVCYGIYEEVTVSNPIMSWAGQHRDQFIWLTSRIDFYEFRFGFKRALSFFCGEAALCTVCLYYFLIISLLRYYKSKFVVGWFWTFLLITTPIFVFLPGTRSGMISFAIGCLIFLSPSYIKKYWLYIVLVVLVSFYFFPSYFQSVWQSIISSDMDSGVEGSSATLRESQWDIAFYYMLNNPLIGNGFGFTSSLLKMEEEGLGGAEGMWLPIMMDQGLIGVISVLMGYVLIILILLKKKMFKYIWIVFSFFVFKTLTTVVGVTESYYLLIIVFLLRYHDLILMKSIKKNKTL